MPASTPRRWRRRRPRCKDFRAWIAEHKDELTALQVLYAGTRPLKLSLKDLRQLRDALCTPAACRDAGAALARLPGGREPRRSEASGGEQLADLVQLVRHALEPDDARSCPTPKRCARDYAAWLAENGRRRRAFSAEQREWLDRMAEHIATSLAIEPEDFEDGWFGQHGSLGRAHALFGDQLRPLMRN